MRRNDPAVPMRRESVALPIPVQIALWLCRRFGRLVALVCSTPVLLALVLYTVGLCWVGLAYGTTAMAAAFGSTLLLVVAACLIWHRLRPEGFSRFVASPVRGQVRRLMVYRRYWQPALSNAGLTRTAGPDREDVPRLHRVISTRYTDRVRVRVLRGQGLSDWALHCDQLAQAFDCDQVRIASVTNRRGLVQRQYLELVALVNDPLGDAVPPIHHDISDELEHADNVDLSALPIAWTEDKTLFRLGLLGNHVLVAGATGAGKGSFIWNLAKALGPAVRSGRVRPVGLDPKGGIELGFAAGFWWRIIRGEITEETAASDAAQKSLEEFAAALDELVLIMARRLATMQGNSRLHVPTTDEPLYVVVIDELAALTAYVADRKLKDRINNSLSVLLTQGRAPGVLVVACLQDPRKEVVPQRGLFPIRIGMRLNEVTETDLIMGQGARERGAACHRIAKSMPGTAYVLVDDQPEAIRLRFPWISDEEVRDIGRYGVNSAALALVSEAA